MSNYDGMMGLLEGLGKGMAGMGSALEKNALMAAQDQRQANREKVRREWAATQEQEKYDRNRADQLTDIETANTRHDTIRAEGRQSTC